ncbi:DUF1445 domain-containing protein [Mesorhizobium sp. M0220]
MVAMPAAAPGRMAAAQRCLLHHGVVVQIVGEMIRQTTDIIDLWRDDFSAFALGSSLTLEAALIEKGVKFRRIGRGKTDPKFRTKIETSQVGPFGGEMVVSMRPIRYSDVDKVRALTVLTARFPHAHGSLMHVGEPTTIGIRNLMAPWAMPSKSWKGRCLYCGPAA